MLHHECSKLPARCCCKPVASMACGFSSSPTWPFATIIIQPSCLGDAVTSAAVVCRVASAGAGTTTAAMPGTLQPPGPFAYGTEAADLAGQTQEVFQATIAFPVSTLAVTGPTPAFVGTPLGPGSAAPAPTPATAAAVTAAATAAAAAAGSDGRQWGSGVAQRLDGSAFGMGPAAMQQRLEARLQEALGDRFEEAAGDEDMQDGVQQVRGGCVLFKGWERKAELVTHESRHIVQYTEEGVARVGAAEARLQEVPGDRIEAENSDKAC